MSLRYLVIPKANVASPHWLPIVATADAQTGTDRNNFPHGITAAYNHILFNLICFENLK